MSFEIEQKYRCESHEAIARRLSAFATTAGPPESQEDVYLATVSRLRRDPRGAPGPVGRSRERDHLQGPETRGADKTREEIEAPGERARALLDVLRVLGLLGFRTVAAIRKVRTTYPFTHLGHPVEVVLDAAEGLGTFVEIETLVEGESDLAKGQRVVLDLAEALGLTEVEPRSYLRMTWRERRLRPDRSDRPVSVDARGGRRVYAAGGRPATRRTGRFGDDSLQKRRPTGRWCMARPKTAAAPPVHRRSVPGKAIARARRTPRARPPLAVSDTPGGDHRTTIKGVVMRSGIGGDSRS